MKLNDFFVQIARSKLSQEEFDDLMSRAVAAERRRIDALPISPVRQHVERPVTAARIEAHLNDSDPPPFEAPHIAERLEERLDITIGPSELGALAAFVRSKGPNVKAFRTEMSKVVHYEVNWFGKHFVVVYNESRQTLITAFPKVKRKPKRLQIRHADLPRERMRIRDVDDDD